MPVICAGEMDAWLIAWLGLWAAPITADPAWQGGAYAPEAQPSAGLTLALKLITLQANHWLWTDAQFGRAYADPDANPADALGNSTGSKLRSPPSPPSAPKFPTPTTCSISSRPTRLSPPGRAARWPISNDPGQNAPALQPGGSGLPRREGATAAAIAKGGTPVETAEIHGPFGHANGLFAIAPLGERIRDFLAR